MSHDEIIEKLREIAKHYYEDDWPMYDLQNDLESLFTEVLK